MEMSSDAIILMALGLFVCGFMITRGALELVSLVMVPAAVMGVLAMKAYFPEPLIWACALGAIVLGLLSFKDKPGFNLIVWGGILGVGVIVLKVFLPPVLLTRLALSVVFLGLLKFLLM